jgi:acetyl-CoA carboxylase biotin carboxyl carrier protein
MTDRVDDALRAIERAATDLLPQLSERLRRHGLGEIEVRHGALRLRVAAPDGIPEPQVPARPDAGASPPPASPPAATAPDGDGIRAPAVGFFIYAEGLGPGLAVEKGDAIGWVEMLGVRHDVRSPRRGTVRNLVAESGEPVEYGQVVVELGAAEASR